MKAVKSINTQSSHDHNNGKVVENPWSDLRRFTDARIGLGRAGISLPTAEMLAFQLSHAQARDAVNFPLDISEMTKTLSAIDALSVVEKPLSVQSEAVDRVTYLQRPDLGRKLNQAGRTTLLNTMQSRQSSTQAQYDLAIVVVDGLSSLAVQKNAAPFISELLKQLPTEPSPYKIAPITLVEQGRVAIGDDIGELLNAQVVMVLIGERPGLSSPDSLGLYLTWEPKTGLNDACRNCISNIRPAGLSYFEAARRAVYLLQEAKKCGLTGVNLKDRTQDDVIEHQVQTTNFLIAE
ncbi:MULTISPECIES: ethanolamine ammonia-lyase subunit EutC [Pseudoalteromonas]|uniref:Ethanolamine ammonia-lyase small subunit n=1 Tax=Pseudoalteromonas agarivorans TaxID=176102 RepID=A0ABR5VTY1_9GAMM|nr:MULTISPECIES: ethanolamine ammonia-lyase subunit EutC [Pseudoalteromonas]KYL33815.1 ethanolamine ammonia-lyase [Pseudoalteromonas telluritireducens]MDC9496780.1 ethanolamine ammonia-lyase subunit EutC [Pseudoalteromonas sp. Angola-20]MDC9516572.1 ethanolamine ammonia-lyase subunit EutC [Pseudoalteromonas sp. Angola-22]MDC9532931.1 ethanolamine ammonia-lyase subunit EutC [Pseudoalteromonas sp. Angola-9]TMP84329.1 ethanolamine ammonia-lyase subunit EutC [Pseudoalteromonas sp. S983]